MKLSKLNFLWLGTSAVFCTMPFVWVDLLSFNSLKFKPIHVSFLLLTAANITLYPRYLLATVKNPWVFGVGFFVLAQLLWMLVSTLWGSREYALIAKLAIHLGFFVIMVNSVVLLIRYNRLGSALYWGAVLGVGGLLIWWTVVFAALGRNLWLEYLTAVVQADTIALQFRFYDPLFNCSLAGICLPGSNAEALRDSARITLMGSYVFYTVGLLLYFWRFEHRQTRLVAAIILGVCMLLTLLTVSRAAIIGLALTLLVPLTHAALKSGARIRRSSLGLASAGGVLAVAAAFSQYGSSATEIALTRLSAISNDARMYTMGAAWSSWSSPLFGEGTGAVVLTVSGMEYGLHHFLLKAVYETGLVGGALAIAWFLPIVVLATRVLVGKVGVAVPSARGLIAAAAVLPVLRLQVGAIGMPTLQEWIALALMFAFVIGYPLEGRWLHGARSVDRNMSLPARTLIS
jgi:hypothetical protein